MIPGRRTLFFAPDDVSLLVAADDLEDMSFSASEPAGAELCSFAPVEVSAPAAGGD